MIRSFVRLGEFDLTTETETKHMDINVIKVKFRTKKNNMLKILIYDSTDVELCIHSSMLNILITVLHIIIVLIWQFCY